MQVAAIHRPPLVWDRPRGLDARAYAIREMRALGVCEAALQRVASMPDDGATLERWCLRLLEADAEG